MKMTLKTLLWRKGLLPLGNFQALESQVLESNYQKTNSANCLEPKPDHSLTDFLLHLGLLLKYVDQNELRMKGTDWIENGE